MPHLLPPAVRRTPTVRVGMMDRLWMLLVAVVALGSLLGSAAARPAIEEEPLEPAPARTPPAVVATASPALRSDQSWGAIELLRRTISPGDKRRLAFPPSGPTEYLKDLPVLVARGVEPGPTLCLTAGIHGDELNGVEIARHVFEHATPAGLAGTLVVMPIVNMHGFLNGSRYLADRRDLNRAFPGARTGSASSRMAHGVFIEVVQHCDALIDLHTGSLERTNLPQVRGDLALPGVRPLALAFGVDVVLDGRGPRGSLRAAAVEAGIPTILYEAGEPGRFQDVEIAHGVDGVRNVMAKLRMIADPGLTRRRSRVFRQTRWVRADAAGIFRPDRQLGDVVARGEVLGTVTNPVTNERTRVVTAREGRIVGMALPQVVLSGFALFHLGMDEEGQ